MRPYHSNDPSQLALPLDEAQKGPSTAIEPSTPPYGPPQAPNRPQRKLGTPAFVPKRPEKPYRNRWNKWTLGQIGLNVRDMPGGCEEWQGATTKSGYGRVSVEGKVHRVHRYVYEATVGPIPPGHYVTHRCDNRLCIAIDHLRLGTHQDNMDDMTSRQRQARGSRQGRARFTDSDVLLMRWMYFMGGERRGLQAKIARLMKANPRSLTLILRGKTWTHLPILSKLPG